MNDFPAAGSFQSSVKFSVNWSGEVVQGVEFHKCLFERCVFEQTVFRDCVFENCEFVSCDLTLAGFALSTLNPVAFRECKLHGIAWHAAEKTFEAAFLDCQLDYSSFHGMKLNKLRFTGSRLTDVTLEDAVARDARFDGCDLSGTIFNRTDLSRADFTGARNYQIDVRNNQVKGAIFDLPEAVNLLLPLGIKVR